MRPLVRNPVDHPFRQLQVAVIRHHHRAAHDTRHPGDVPGIHLRQVQVDHVGLTDQTQRPPGQGGHNHPFAQAHRHRQANNVHPILIFLFGQIRAEARCQYRHLVAQFCQAAGQSFGINREPGIMRAIIRQTNQDTHRCKNLPRAANFGIQLGNRLAFPRQCKSADQARKDQVDDVHD